MEPEARDGRRFAALDWALLAGLLATGGIVRTAYVLLSGQTRFDPWRHLALIRSLREGEGFSLFEGQPYLWHGPVWHRLCALAPEAIRPEWLALAFSLGCVALLFVLVRREAEPREEARQAATLAGLLAALSGPIVAYTCNLGPEALALFAALGAIVLCAVRRGSGAALLAGGAFGLAVVLRTNTAFLFPLALPRLATPARIVAFGVGSALPLMATWLRNRAIVTSHPWVFTWDGLAVRGESFGPLSTLILQLHPDVAEALRRLHERTMPMPEWIRGPDGTSWGLMLLVASGVLAVALSRSKALIATTVVVLGYGLLLDDTLSSNHFRILLPLLPVFFLAAASLAAGGSRQRLLAWSLAALMLAGGARSFRSPQMPALEAATPPAGLLREEAYLVPSGFFHPDSLILRFPDKRFIGMPLRPEDLEDFLAAYPGYRSILWHGYSVQTELGSHLKKSSRWQVVRRGVNDAGRSYAVLREAPAPAATEPSATVDP